jgi:hypothetical protein
MLNRIGEILNLLNSRIAIIFLGLQGKDTSKATLIWEQREYFKFPNSTPIGADLVFDSEEGFRVHIDIKTALDQNPADWQGVVNVGKNQTSYTIPSMFNADLPTRSRIELMLFF